MAIIQHHESRFCKNCARKYRFHWLTSSTGKLISGELPVRCPSCGGEVTFTSTCSGNHSPFEAAKGKALVWNERESS